MVAASTPGLLLLELHSPARPTRRRKTTARLPGHLSRDDGGDCASTRALQARSGGNAYVIPPNTVRLPALPAGEEPAPGPSEPSQSVASARVLVVEDNPDAAEALCLLLELLGHHVRVAHSGPEALEAVRAEAPAVALVDIGLPGMSGYEPVRQLRQQPSMGGHSSSRSAATAARRTGCARSRPGFTST